MQLQGEDSKHSPDAPEHHEEVKFDIILQTYTDTVLFFKLKRRNVIVSIQVAEPTCEAVFGVTPVALHPGERQGAHVLDVFYDLRHRRAPAAQRSVCRNADDPRSGR